MKNNIKSKNMLSAMLFSYSTVIIGLIFIFAVISYFIVSTNIEKRGASAGTATLEKTVNWIDFSLENLEESVNQMMGQQFVEDFTDFEYGGGLMTPDDVLKINTMTEQFRGYFLNNSIIENAYLYSYRTQRVLTTEGSFIMINDMIDNNWQQLLSSDMPINLWKPRSVGSDETINLTLIKSFPAFSSNPDVAFIVNVSENKIQNYIDSIMKMQGGMAVVSDTDGKIISHTEKNLIGTDINESLSVYEKIENSIKVEPISFSYGIKSRNILYSCVSDYTDWRYIYIADSNRTGTWLFTIILLLVIIMSCVCIFIVKNISQRIYMPVENLVNSVIEKTSLKNDNIRETDYLKEVIDRLDVERDELSKLLRENIYAIKQNYITNVIYGMKISRSKLEQQRSYLNLDFTANMFHVAVIKINEYDRFCSENNRFDRELLCYGASNIAEELINEKYTGIACDIEQSRIVILFCVNNYDDSVMEVLENIKKQIDSYMEFSVSIGCGKLVSGLEHTYRSYVQAQQAFEKCGLVEGVSMYDDSMEKTGEYSEEQLRKRKTHINRAIQCINENYNEDISLEWVSEQINISPQYISMLFKQDFGENFLSYLNRIRVEKAKHFLGDKQTFYKINTIGEMVGFNNVNTFMRVFKKYTGMTPGKYREMINENNR